MSASEGWWSVKGDVVQVQPPASVMAGMVAVRLHLDDCPADNGALRVLPGSHERGRLDDEIDAWRARVDAVACAVPAGGAVVMKPLLLHASSPAARPSRRRVIHIEYASAELPGGLEWRERVDTDPGAGCLMTLRSGRRADSNAVAGDDDESASKGLDGERGD